MDVDVLQDESLLMGQYRLPLDHLIYLFSSPSVGLQQVISDLGARQHTAHTAKTAQTRTACTTRTTSLATDDFVGGE